MRKLKLQMQVSIDGFVAGPNGEMDWMTWTWDDALKNYVSELTSGIDCIVMGTKLADGFIPYWAKVAVDDSNPERPFGVIMTDTPKVVFTQTLTDCPWENTTLARGPIVNEINNLKAQDGKDMITYGGAGFASSLIQNDLIDEYHLFINPTAIESGLPIFAKLDHKLNLKLVHSIGFECGIVVMCYRNE
ncbi:MAG: dihydrofolate reductase family protein [Ignavibacteria bacterium]|nr:dihydrofolate reductase family protein [Ignavibacteria bacterium]